ncbi:MAG: hypothetical protein AB8G77_15095 [Rhodothermales bacterium]
MQEGDITAFFWGLATPLLDDMRITKSTMMGFPCLRVDGDFFASANPKTGDLVVKLPADRVLSLIEEDQGSTFAPAGRRFREWVVISTRDATQWAALIAESRQFVAQK